MSGVVVRDGAPAFVTLLGCEDEAGAWRRNRAAGGAIVDVVSDEVVANGLAMPFSPRWHEGRLWFTQAGTGELCVVDDDDSVTPVIGLPTFLRGLAFVGPYAVVAGSGSRSVDLVDGLPIGDRWRRRGSARPRACSSSTPVRASSSTASPSRGPGARSRRGGPAGSASAGPHRHPTTASSR